MSTVTTSSTLEFSPVLGHHVYAGTDTPALSEREAQILTDLAEDGLRPAPANHVDEPPF